MIGPEAIALREFIYLVVKVNLKDNHTSSSFVTFIKISFLF